MSSSLTITMPPDKRIGLLDESDPVQFCAMEACCVHMCLDDENIPRSDENGERYSLWGRILQLLEKDKD